MKHPMIYGSGKCVKICLFTLTFFLSYLQVQNAQRPSPSVGIGFQAGVPSGLSLQFYKSQGMSTDLLFAYDFNNFFFMNIHGLWNTHLDNGGHFHVFYGPGAFIGIQRLRSEFLNDEVSAGVSGNFGINLVISRLELFAQVTPRLEVTPGTHLNYGGGVGLRFFF